MILSPRNTGDSRSQIAAGDVVQQLLDDIDARSRVAPPVSHLPKGGQSPPGFPMANNPKAVAGALAEFFAAER